MLIDDRAGSEIKSGDGSTVVFAFEGTTYQIDLNDKRYGQEQADA